MVSTRLPVGGIMLGHYDNTLCPGSDIQWQK